MSIRKRIAALGAAAVMAASMCAMGASAVSDNTFDNKPVRVGANYFINTFTPWTTLKGDGGRIESREYYYNLDYKLADISATAMVKLPKNCGSGKVTLACDYIHCGRTVLSENSTMGSKSYTNSQAGKMFIVPLSTRSNRSIKKGGYCKASFRIQSPSKLQNKTFTSSMDVKYHN